VRIGKPLFRRLETDLAGRVDLLTGTGLSSRPNDAFKAVARAASPSTRSAQASSTPLRFFFNVNFRPRGEIVSTYSQSTAEIFLQRSGHRLASPLQGFPILMNFLLSGALRAVPQAALMRSQSYGRAGVLQVERVSG
jgi:hypothetical protein